jgi:hypothetical protein
MGLLFEGDERKAAENLRRHGVSFDEAATTFGDPASLTIGDPAHSAEEDRFIILATSVRLRLLVTVFTEREDRIRIITSRRANDDERQQYEQRFQSE